MASQKAQKKAKRQRGGSNWSGMKPTGKGAEKTTMLPNGAEIPEGKRCARNRFLQLTKLTEFAPYL
jgi:hypothetical protein